MRVGAPFGEAPDPLKHALIGRVKKMRAIPVTEDAIRPDLIVGVAGNMRTFVDNENGKSRFGECPSVNAP